MYLNSNIYTYVFDLCILNVSQKQNYVTFLKRERRNVRHDFVLSQTIIIITAIINYMIC